MLDIEHGNNRYIPTETDCDGSGDADLYYMAWVTCDWLLVGAGFNYFGGANNNYKGKGASRDINDLLLRPLYAD